MTEFDKRSRDDIEDRLERIEHKLNTVHQATIALIEEIKAFGVHIDTVEAAILLAFRHPATHLQILIGGTPIMSTVTLDVDVTGETVSAQYVDDKGDVTTDVPDGTTLNYSSSDETVATVDATSGALGFLKAGTATITAASTDSAVSPASVDLVLTPGLAAGLEVSVAGAAPVPAPPAA